MKCFKSDCDRGIGLLSYRRGWFERMPTGPTTQRKMCQRERKTATYFEWLCLMPIEQPKQVPVVIRARAR
jgi:hypothetical protein